MMVPQVNGLFSSVSHILSAVNRLHGKCFLLTAGPKIREMKENNSKIRPAVKHFEEEK